MKKYILIIMAAALLLVSCKDMLNTAPANQISSGNMWSNAALAEKGMNGLYYNFYMTKSDRDRAVKILPEYTSGICRHIWMGMEFQSYNVKDSGLYNLLDATKDPDDYAVTYEWQWCYTGIHRINDALENLYKAGLSTEQYEKYMCEAYFLRAWYYTRLNQIFQGVPLYLQVISESECTKGQNTSTEVWQAVIDDLNYCIDNEYMLKNTLSEDYGRPSKGAAYALRGNAYMWLAWENGDDNEYYQLAANDFEQVGECGYGLWQGTYTDFFLAANEKDKEMVFPLQFTGETGYNADYTELLFAGYDTYGGYSCIRPEFAFVSYYKNADGTDFDWAQYIPEWDYDEFVNDISKREIFFFRDGIHLDDDGNVIADNFTSSEATSIQARVNIVGREIFDKYYLPDGNEARIKSCFDNRDPRLKLTILTPYDPIDGYRDSYNGGNVMYNKEKRWPYIGTAGDGDGCDYYCGVTPGEQTYLYKKFLYFYPGEISNRTTVPTDWPLIRYTDVYLHLAECYVHLNRLSEAVDIVNQVRQAIGWTTAPVSVGTADEVFEAVKYERRVSLCGEGVDFFDEIRWGEFQKMKFQGGTNYGPTTYWGEWKNYCQTWYYTDNMYPWGAPLEECLRNPNLTRREGWAY